ncbi:sucrase ferredoxin [Amnibacterium setariae]|uniref:Sucrase ferredoxin n=1 Tax=Amnibacterium setariae TaxID=2306585 RepID=A0A3A1UA08_9MICO|nr:sucrase ferredoxin [Amnibacterium setariae]RIX31069.1 sucrase ferredoxin [Amnibacterium setariae]
MSGIRSTVPRGSLSPHRDGGPACSAASRLLDESLVATAAPGTRWLLVEVAGAWGWNAFTESPVLDPEVGRALAARTHRAGVRLLAIRRPGRARGPVRWRWAVVDSREGAEGVRWGEAAAARDLLDVPLDGSTGEPSDEPILAVCAQGRHDECCAVRGRPVAARLAARFPEATWECSHIGGDRFAATMILFPHALTYGRIDDGDPVHVVTEYRAGRIAPEGFRGRASVPRIVQAAQSAAMAATGNRALDAHAPLALDERPGAWLVDLAGEPPTRVLVEGVQEGPLFTTCLATVPVTVAGFRAAVEPGGDAPIRQPPDPAHRPHDSGLRSTGGAPD